MKVAIIGTRGLPANYGGFETLAENLVGKNKAPEVEYTVFCSSKDQPAKLASYKGALLEYVPLHANGAQSILYDIISMIMVPKDVDIILILGVSGCAFLPLYRIFSKKKIITNIDGLEHRRAKWSRPVKWFLRFSEKMAVKYSDIIVSDNKGIADYVTGTYGKTSETIAYGGDHAIAEVSAEIINQTLGAYGLEAGKYAITVCRVEPENNPEIILEAFRRTGKRLVFIGNWAGSRYSRYLREKYSQSPNLMLLDAIYDIEKLYVLRSNAGLYVHGHSAGGTNPSLVEAMHFGIPTAAFDVVYNRETTGGEALYFKDVDTLTGLLSSGTGLEDCAAAMKRKAAEEYTWKKIVSKYEALYR